MTMPNEMDQARIEEMILCVRFIFDELIVSVKPNSMHSSFLSSFGCQRQRQSRQYFLVGSIFFFALHTNRFAHLFWIIFYFTSPRCREWLLPIFDDIAIRRNVCFVSTLSSLLPSSRALSSIETKCMPSKRVQCIFFSLQNFNSKNKKMPKGHLQMRRTIKSFPNKIDWKSNEKFAVKWSNRSEKCCPEQRKKLCRSNGSDQNRFSCSNVKRFISRRSAVISDNDESFNGSTEISIHVCNRFLRSLHCTNPFAKCFSFCRMRWWRRRTKNCGDVDAHTNLTIKKSFELHSM